ncbi:unnamed protein product [Rotaria magnacalcarata]|uniref:THAP-type domain-containing protein n=1 Tax=Rotaria magnacalcarata TaxID=392030 RepID=A0A818WD10_9BILA|nr:unnamed protein product [Rotaria magnacalcarata]CAF2053670.1 unnamed protein product [Rotaria magnacalcarata]CAF3723818.1 unnamed protein product [Rotaria magnacalcarata]CAF3832303.1 unnamed protein product [Rotaria magnacalcarata]
MVHNCAIISCPLHNRRNIRKGLLFHSFPVDQHRFELWRQTVFNHCAQTLSINKHSKICYQHFHPDDYIANHTGLTRYLKATATPSIFTQNNSTSKNLHPSATLNNHLLTSSTNSNTNRSIKLSTLLETPPTLFILPSKSSSSIALPTLTDTKAKRLLNTIDKLHQIQNANKIVMTQKIISENENEKQDYDNNNNNNNNTIIEKQTLKATQLINDNQVLRDNLMEPKELFLINHQNVIKERQTIQDTFQHSSMDSNTFRRVENVVMSSPKNHLEDTLYKFLEQANLLQYYSAFIEQGGDDLKQLAEAQNDDFQEIITLVGMVSKPLHIKRFKRALTDYRQSMNHSDIEHSFSNSSYSTILTHRLSADEPLSDRNLLSSLITSTSTNNSPKPINQISSNWCINKTDNSKTNNSHQLIDDSQRKRIADEAERLANLLPVTSIKKLNGRSNISKDLFTTMNLPRDFEDRWQRIRKYSAIYNRFDSKTPNQVLSLHEILINEAAAAICFHRPEFLTRRDELLHLARRVLQNIGIPTTNIQKRPLTMLTCDIVPAKQVKLNVSASKAHTRQRDPDAFRLMWHNREAKVEQIPIQIEAFRYEQNQLLQQLKQNAIDSSSSSVDNICLKKKIDDLSKQIEQLNDEEKNLRRLIRKRNMRLRAKERQQQKQQMLVHHSSTIQDLILPIIPITPSTSTLPNDIIEDQLTTTPLTQIFETNTDMFHSINIKDEKVEPYTNLSSPVLQARKEFSQAKLIAKPINKRREEINESSIVLNKETISQSKSSHSTQRNHSSSTTAIDLVLDPDFHSYKPTNILATCHNEQDIVESKSFIHTLDFNVRT